MVDGQIIADLMHIAYSQKTNTVLILMTGDTDMVMVPSLEHIFRSTTTMMKYMDGKDLCPGITSTYRKFTLQEYLLNT